MFDIIPTSGALAPNPLPRVPGQVSPSAVAIVAGDAPVQAVGKFAYAANNAGDSISLYAVGASGALTALPSLDVTGTSPQAIAVDPSSHYLYVSNNNDDSISQYAIGSDGKLTALNPDSVAAGTFPGGVAIHPSGRFAYALNQTTQPLAIRGGNRRNAHTAFAGDGRCQHQRWADRDRGRAERPIRVHQRRKRKRGALRGRGEWNAITAVPGDCPHRDGPKLDRGQSLG